MSISTGAAEAGALAELETEGGALWYMTIPPLTQTSIRPFIAAGAGYVHGREPLLQLIFCGRDLISARTRPCAQFAHYDLVPVHRLCHASDGSAGEPFASALDYGCLILSPLRTAAVQPDPADFAAVDVSGHQRPSCRRQRATAFGEGFGMPARRDPSSPTEGRRPKAPRKEPAGAGRAVCRLWGFDGVTACVEDALDGVGGGGSTIAVGSLSSRRPSTW